MALRRPNTQGGDDFGGWLKKQIVGHIINDVFKSDLSERRFRNDLENTAVTKVKDGMFTQNVGMINAVELGNADYEDYFKTFDKNVQAQYREHVDRFGHNPFVDSMYDTAMNVRDDEFKKHEAFFQRKDTRTDLKNRVRGLRDDMRTDPFNVDTSVAISLMDEVTDFGEANLGKIHQTERNAFIGDLHKELNKVISVSSAMNRLDTDTETDGMQLGKYMDDMEISTAYGKMSGKKAWAQAAKFIEGGETAKGIAILDRMMPFDLTMDRLATATHDKEVKSYKTLIDNYGAETVSFYNNAINTITAGMSENGEFDSSFSKIMRQTGLTEGKLVNVKDAGIDTIQGKVDMLGRSVYSLLVESDVDRGNASSAGAGGTYTSEELRNNLLGETVIVNGEKMLATPGILYKNMGFKPEMLDGKKIQENIDYNNTLREDMDGTIADGFRALAGDIDADWGVGSSDSPNNEEAKRVMDAMMLYIKMNDKVDMMKLGDELYRTKTQKGAPKYGDEKALGDKAMKEEVQNTNNLITGDGDRTNENYNNNNSNGKNSRNDSNLSASNKVDDELVSNSPVSRKFRNNLSYMDLDSMTLPDYIYAEGGEDILAEALTQYVNDVNSIRTFESRSDLDEQYGLSAIAGQTKGLVDTQRDNLGNVVDTIAMDEEFTISGEVQKAGIREDSLLGLKGKKRDLQIVMLEKKKNLREDIKSKEKNYVDMVNLYKPNVWFPTWGANYKTFANMKPGDDGYNERVTLAAQEYVRSEESLKGHNSSVAKLQRKQGTSGSPDFTTEQEQDRYSLLAQQFNPTMLDNASPEVENYLAKKKSLDDSRRILRSIVSNDEDFNDIMLTILDNNTEGQFTVQNGIIYMPGSEAIPDDLAFAD